MWKIVRRLARGAPGRLALGARRPRVAQRASPLAFRGRMPRFWFWVQILILVFVVAGMVIAITKLA